MGNLENRYLKKEVSHLLRMTILDTWDMFYLDFFVFKCTYFKNKIGIRPSLLFYVFFLILTFFFVCH